MFILLYQSHLHRYNLSKWAQSHPVTQEVSSTNIHIFKARSLTHLISIRSTRNKAILSIFAVMAGSWMLFRAQSPNKDDVLLSKADVDTTLKGQTTRGKSGRSMAHQDQD